MKPSDNLLQNEPQISFDQVLEKSKISFSSFHKLILANSKMRKQIKDVVDLALFDYALKKNETRIQAIRLKAEAETLQLLMKFANGMANYNLVSRIIHRNRVIKTLANLDRKDQDALMQKFAHPMAV